MAYCILGFWCRAKPKAVGIQINLQITAVYMLKQSLQRLAFTQRELSQLLLDFSCNLRISGREGPVLRGFLL